MTSHGKYGVWDSDLGIITEIIVEYSYDENNHYVYKELSKQE